MHRKLTVFLLALALSAVVVLPGAAAPLDTSPLRDFLAAPCIAGAAYDPACDVNHDGTVNVLDVQLAAGHWNQSGTWTGGGDGWSLTGNAGTNPASNFLGTTDGQPLAIQPAGGNTGIGTSTPNARFNVVGTSWFQGDSTPLPAAAGKGIAIGFTGEQGYIYGFDYATWTHKNLIVQHDGGKVAIGTSTPAPAKLTVITVTEEHGMYVSSAGYDGVHVGSAGGDGVHVRSTGTDGVFVFSAGDDGVDVYGGSLAGYFSGNIQVTGNCSGCLLVTFGINAGDKPLEPGDLVSLAGLRASGVDSVPMLLEVQAATGDDAVVGVVQGWAELITEEEPRPTEIGLRLVPREGVVEPGQYVTIAYSGLAQVKASGPLVKGARLTVGDDGRARTLQTRTLDGMEVTEGAQPIGVALEALDEGEGLIWALVNVQ